MFKALLVLGVIANCISILSLLYYFLSNVWHVYFGNGIGNLSYRKDITNCRTAGAVFFLIAWLLGGDPYNTINGLTSFDRVSRVILVMGVIWSVVFFVNIIANMVITQKDPRGRGASLETPISSLVFGIVYIVLSFIIH